jgi:hypothetical protein
MVWCDLCMPLHSLASSFSMPLISLPHYFSISFVSMCLGCNYPLPGLKLVLLGLACARISGALACACILNSHITSASLRKPEINASDITPTLFRHFICEHASWVRLPSPWLTTCAIRVGLHSYIWGARLRLHPRL